jgi:hypothetical protein
MRLTAIIEDAAVIVDGVARAVSMPACDANWTAIQWYGTHGTIEVKIGDRIWLETDEALAPFVAAWEAAEPTPEVVP